MTKTLPLACLMLDLLAATGTSPPRLLVTVTGVVRHISPSKLTSQPISARSIPQHTTDPLPTSTDLEYVLPNTLPNALSNDAGGSGRNRGKEMLDEETIKGLPRAFVEVFELVAEEEGTGAVGSQPKVCSNSVPDWFDTYKAYRPW